MEPIAGYEAGDQEQPAVEDSKIERLRSDPQVIAEVEHALAALARGSWRRQPGRVARVRELMLGEPLPPQITGQGREN